MKARLLFLFALLMVGAWAPLPSRAGGETPVNSYTVVGLGRMRVTYTYVVTAVDNRGLESAPSNPASATAR
jgi:hypothetical protein